MRKTPRARAVITVFALALTVSALALTSLARDRSVLVAKGSQSAAMAPVSSHSQR